jgi:hypothetical protein
MGLEPLILFLWGGQLIAMAILAWRLALNSRWFAALGIVSGAVFGCMPFFLVKGPAAFAPAIFIVIASIGVLTVAYVIARRWIALAAVLFFCAIPLAYRIVLYAQIPPGANPLLRIAAMLGEGAFLLSPLFCALACREIFGLLDLRFTMRRGV